MSEPIVNLPALEGAWMHEEGVTRPQWRAIYDLIQATVQKEDVGKAWRQIAKHWLERLASDFRGPYSVCESPNILFLGCKGNDQMLGIVRHAEKVNASIPRMLPEVVFQDGAGPRVILLFETQEDYIAYTSYFHPEGHHASSAGMFLRDGYRHVAVRATAEWHVLETITHELAHACLSCVKLPLWLEEGVVDLVTESIHPSRAIPMTRELRERHLRHWNRHGLASFWSGRSFHTPKGQELSYSLARVLVRNLTSDHRKSFQKFLRDAKVADHGASAMSEHLGITLGECAAMFLGDGDWEPAASRNSIPSPHKRAQRRGDGH